MSEARATATKHLPIWALGGGKGGQGRSLLTAALAWELGRLGRQVVLVDADPRDSHLHVIFGMPRPTVTLSDYTKRHVDRIEEIALETGHPGVRLVSGAGGILLSANVRRTQKARLLTQVRELGADVIMLDLGAGHSENVIDLFGLAEKSLLLVKPEPTAVMSVYQFIKAAAFRRMAALTLGEASRQMIHESLEEHPDDLPRPLDLIRTIELSDAETARRLRDDLHAMQPYLVVNEARADQDLILGQQMALACERHIGVGARCAGTIRHDDAVWHGIRQGRLFMADPNSPASEDVRLLARKLLKNGETGSQKA